MALVNMTEKLRDQIVRHAKALFEKRIKDAQVAEAAFGDRVYAAWLRDSGQHILDLLQSQGKADEWTESTGTLNLTRIAGGSINTVFRLSTDRLLPCAYYGTPEISLSDAHMDLYTEIKTRQQETKDLIAERDNFGREVHEVLKKCKTLKHALEAWPELWDLLDPDTKAKHYEKVERQKGVRPEIQLDRDGLTATLVTAKIVNSG